MNVVIIPGSYSVGERKEFFGLQTSKSDRVFI